MQRINVITPTSDGQRLPSFVMVEDEEADETIAIYRSIPEMEVVSVEPDNPAIVSGKPLLTLPKPSNGEDKARA